MDLSVQKRIAASILKCSEKRVLFDKERLEEIKEAITKEDIRKLVNSRAIIKKQKAGVSRARARIRQIKKRQGRYKGFGSRKGKKGARMGKKELWINRVRLQRNILKEFKKEHKIKSDILRSLYKKVKGGYFRSKRHLLLYINQHNLISKTDKKPDYQSSLK